MFETILILVAAIIAVMLASKSAEGSAQPVTGRPNPTPYDGLIAKYAKLNGIRFELLKGIIKRESGFNPRALNEERKIEPTGPGVADGDDAIGLMQVRAGALQDFNAAKGTAYMLMHLFDPDINIMVGSWYVSQFVNRFGESVGLEMYNTGETGYRRGVRNAQYVADIQQFAARYA